MCVFSCDLVDASGDKRIIIGIIESTVDVIDRAECGTVEVVRENNSCNTLRPKKIGTIIHVTFKHAHRATVDLKAGRLRVSE